MCVHDDEEEAERENTREKREQTMSSTSGSYLLTPHPVLSLSQIMVNGAAGLNPTEQGKNSTWPLFNSVYIVTGGAEAESADVNLQVSLLCLSPSLSVYISLCVCVFGCFMLTFSLPTFFFSGSKAVPLPLTLQSP